MATREDRSQCHSFVATDGSDDLIVQYAWDGESIGLELVRMKASAVRSTPQTIHWGDAALGVTFGIEETSRRVIVTKTTRADVRPGDVLVRARGEEINEANFDEKMASLKLAHSISHGIPFEFAPPPPPLYVKSCAGSLKNAGVDSSFELRYVDGYTVRYLSMEELNAFIRKAPKPCKMTFVQRKENQYLQSLRREAKEDTLTAGGLAAVAAVIAISLS
ncbi:hypothetical protein FI667_g8075, partial [Globisporangium splendens]